MQYKLISLRFFSHLAFPILLLLFAGCGNDRLETFAVKGQLKFEDGSTPMFGVVEFYNAENSINARGKIQRDGSFTVTTYRQGDGAVSGEHEIVIFQNTGTYLTAETPRIVHDHGELVDPNYNDYRSSGLTCTIFEKELNHVELTLHKYAYQTEDGLPPGNPLPESGSSD